MQFYLQFVPTLALPRSGSWVGVIQLPLSRIASAPRQY